jgi:hypothetical protein
MQGVNRRNATENYYCLIVILATNYKLKTSFQMLNSLEVGELI